MFARYFAQLLLGVKRDKGLSHERGMWILKRDRYASFSHTLFPFLYRVAFLLSSLSLFLFYTSGFPCSPCISSSFPLPPPLPVSRPVSPLETLSIFLSLFRERPRSRNVRVAFVVTANIVGERVREDVDHTSRIRSNQFDPFPARGGGERFHFPWSLYTATLLRKGRERRNRNALYPFLLFPRVNF